MRKIWSVLLVLAILIAVPVSADITTNGEVGYAISSQTLYIAGNIGTNGGTSVTLTLTDGSGNLGYIDQLAVANDGSYSTKFHFTPSLNDYTLRIKEGNADVTDSVEIAEITSPTVFAIRYGVSTADTISAIATIQNKYGNGGTYRMITAFYGADNGLLNVEVSQEKSYTFDEIISEVKTEQLLLPAGTTYTKLFIWSDLTNIKPLVESAVKDVDDICFGGDTQQITVAFIGDSITHQAHYLKGIEHYYQTRYPDKDIIFVNKGISGNTATNVIDRFTWDITGDEYTGKIHEATIMIGMNDIKRKLYEANADNETERQTVINACLNNIEKIIKMCIEEDIILTLITPSAYDESSDEQFLNTTGILYPECNSQGLSEIAKGVKDLAEKYGLPLIDLWTPTTELIAAQRAAGNTGPVITKVDRIHPDENGGFVMSYEFIKQQDPDSVVASVSLDASTGACSSENASVSVVAHDTSGVTYIYKPKAIPMAYGTEYQNAEMVFGLNVTNDINREIIQVTGLQPGTYSIAIGDSILTNTYTAEELAEGVNIAIDANNPGQIQAKAAWTAACNKVKNEGTYRGYALTEQDLLKGNYISLAALREGDWNTLKTAVEDMMTAKPESSFFTTYRQYIGLNSAGTANAIMPYRYKPEQAENYATLRQDEQKARELSKPQEYTVIIASAE